MSTVRAPVSGARRCRSRQRAQPSARACHRCALPLTAVRAAAGVHRVSCVRVHASVRAAAASGARLRVCAGSRHRRLQRPSAPSTTVRVYRCQPRVCARASGAQGSSHWRAAPRVRGPAPPMRTATIGGARRCACLQRLSLVHVCASGARSSNLRRATARVRKLAPPVRAAAAGGVRRCARLCCQPRVRARALGARGSTGARLHVCAKSRHWPAIDAARRCALLQAPVPRACMPHARLERARLGPLGART
eukprot:6181579-Pleurochrysis_carterae.AAC.2